MKQHGKQQREAQRQIETILVVFDREIRHWTYTQPYIADPGHPQAGSCTCRHRYAGIGM